MKAQRWLLSLTAKELQMVLQVVHTAVEEPTLALNEVFVMTSAEKAALRRVYRILISQHALPLDKPKRRAKIKA